MILCAFDTKSNSNFYYMKFVAFFKDFQVSYKISKKLFFNPIVAPVFHDLPIPKLFCI